MIQRRTLIIAIVAVIAIGLLVWGGIYLLQNNRSKKAVSSPVTDSSAVAQPATQKVRTVYVNSGSKEYKKLSAKIDKLLELVGGDDGLTKDAKEIRKALDTGNASLVSIDKAIKQLVVEYRSNRSVNTVSVVNDTTTITNLPANRNMASIDARKTEFCIGIGSGRFLFWELVNSHGQNIPNLVVNSTGKPANMLLSPGQSCAGFRYDGDVLTLSTSSMATYYRQIYGTDMPSDFRPTYRGDRTGWSDKQMSKTGGDFVIRF